MDNRIHYIDVLKGVGIIFVVFAHCNSILFGSGYLYTFHMALFFLISGMLLNPDKYESFKFFLLSRLKQLYFPYVFFYIILYLYWLCAERKLRMIDVPPLDCLLGLFWGTDNTHWIYCSAVMWFVIGLMAIEIVFYCILKYCKSLVIEIIVLFMLTIIGYLLAQHHFYCLPFSLNNVLPIIPYIAIGYLLRKPLVVNEKELTQKKTRLAIVCTPFVLFTIIFYPWICEIGNQTDISILKFPAFYTFYTLPFIEIGMWIIISMIVEKNKLLEWLGRNTLPILAFHPPISRIIIFGGGLLMGVSKDHIREDWAYSICLTFFAIICCIPLVILWNKIYPRLVLMISPNIK